MHFSTLFLELLFSLLVVYIFCSASQKSDTAMLFAPKDLVSVTLMVPDPKGGQVKNLTTFIRGGILKEMGLTKAEVESGTLTRDEEGNLSELKVGERIFDLGIVERPLFEMHSIDGGFRYSMDASSFMARTMQDVVDDSTLIPENAGSIDWNFHRNESIMRISVVMSDLEAWVYINNGMDIAHPIAVKDPKRDVVWGISNSGLLLLVLNPSTGLITYSKVFPTSEFGVYRDLLTILNGTQPGRLVVLASLYDGSLNLRPVHSHLEALGSEWSSSYLFRDKWVLIFKMGGATLADVIVPNTRFGNASGSPLMVEVSLPSQRGALNFGTDCPTWPTGKVWVVRREFCQANDGYGRLCDCVNPFRFPIKEDGKSREEDIPIIVIAGNRTHYLMRLFESLGNQEGVYQEMILVVSDGWLSEVAKLCFLLNIKLLTHKPEGRKAARVSRNLRFALFHGLKQFPVASRFILLEDDLVLARDFYWYMQQTSPIFRMDPTVYCVSAFNHLSYPHTSLNSSRLYRSDSAPAYGWMMSRELLEELIPKWLPSGVSQDWDYFIASAFVRKKRECIIPEINRSYHGGAVGLHLSNSWRTEKDYLSRTLNERKVRLIPLERLVLQRYEHDMIDLIRHAEPLDFEDAYNITFPSSLNDVFVIYVKKLSSSDELAFRVIGDGLRIWNRDARDSHENTWRINYKGKVLLIVGVPLSKYSNLRPANATVYSFEDDARKDLEDEELQVKESVLVVTHGSFSTIPFAGLQIPLLARMGLIPKDRFLLALSRKRNASVSS